VTCFNWSTSQQWEVTLSRLLLVFDKRFFSVAAERSWNSFATHEWTTHRRHCAVCRYHRHHDVYGRYRPRYGE